MNFELLHERELSLERFTTHPLWAQYHEPADIQTIVGWGVPQAQVEEALQSVGWSDSYFFRVLRASDISKFYHFRAAASFCLASGYGCDGFVSDFEPSSISVIHQGRRLLLLQEDPEITSDDETELRSSSGGGLVYPVHIVASAISLKKRTLNPYALRL